MEFSIRSLFFVTAVVAVCLWLLLMLPANARGGVVILVLLGLLVIAIVIAGDFIDVRMKRNRR